MFKYLKENTYIRVAEKLILPYQYDTTIEYDINLIVSIDENTIFNREPDYDELYKSTIIPRKHLTKTNENPGLEASI
jgi:hypothetical protein